jgi:hypothetical protein
VTLGVTNARNKPNERYRNKKWPPSRKLCGQIDGTD